MATALEIVNAACTELGLPEVDTVYGVAAGATARQMGGLLNRVCKELNADYEWTRTMREQTFYLEDPTEQTGNLTAGSKIITGLSDTSGLSNAYAVQNADSTDEANLLQASRIVSVDSSTQVTLNQAAIADGTGIDLQFVRDTYTLDSAMSRYISDTWWDRTNNWRLIGPISPQTDEWLLSGIVQSGPRRRWRQVGPGPSTWRIWPPPFSSGDTPAILAFEYITLAWAVDGDGDYIESMTADDDSPIFPEHVCVLGLEAYFMRAKGFEWKSYYAQFSTAAQRAMSQDGSKQTILIGSTRARDYINEMELANIPDGNWPGPTS